MRLACHSLVSDVSKLCECVEGADDVEASLQVATRGSRRSIGFMGAARCYFNSFKLQRRGLQAEFKKVKLTAESEAASAHGLKKEFLEGMDDLFEAYGLWDQARKEARQAGPTENVLPAHGDFMQVDVAALLDHVAGLPAHAALLAD